MIGQKMSAEDECSITKMTYIYYIFQVVCSLIIHSKHVCVCSGL